MSVCTTLHCESVSARSHAILTHEKGTGGDTCIYCCDGPDVNIFNIVTSTMEFQQECNELKIVFRQEEVPNLPAPL